MKKNSKVRTSGKEKKVKIDNQESKKIKENKKGKVTQPIEKLGMKDKKKTEKSVLNHSKSKPNANRMKNINQGRSSTSPSNKGKRNTTEKSIAGKSFNKYREEIKNCKFTEDKDCETLVLQLDKISIDKWKPEQIGETYLALLEGISRIEYMPKRSRSDINLKIILSLKKTLEIKYGKKNLYEGIENIDSLELRSSILKAILLTVKSNEKLFKENLNFFNDWCRYYPLTKQEMIEMKGVIGKLDLTEQAKKYHLLYIEDSEPEEKQISMMKNMEDEVSVTANKTKRIAGEIELTNSEKNEKVIENTQVIIEKNEQTVETVQVKPKEEKDIEAEREVKAEEDIEAETEVKEEDIEAEKEVKEEQDIEVEKEFKIEEDIKAEVKEEQEIETEIQVKEERDIEEEMEVKAQEEAEDEAKVKVELVVQENMQDVAINELMGNKEVVEAVSTKELEVGEMDVVHEHEDDTSDEIVHIATEEEIIQILKEDIGLLKNELSNSEVERKKIENRCVKLKEEKNVLINKSNRLERNQEELKQTIEQGENTIAELYNTVNKLKEEKKILLQEKYETDERNKKLEETNQTLSMMMEKGDQYKQDAYKGKLANRLSLEQSQFADIKEIIESGVEDEQVRDMMDLLYANLSEVWNILEKNDIRF